MRTGDLVMLRRSMVVSMLRVPMEGCVGTSFIVRPGDLLMVLEAEGKKSGIRLRVTSPRGEVGWTWDDWLEVA